MSLQNCKIIGVGIDSEKYHKDKSSVERGDPKFIMSPSSIKAFSRCPSRWVKGWNPPESKAMRWGRLLDCRVLTPSQFVSKYAWHPPTYRVQIMECPECGSQSQSRTCKACKTNRAPIDVEKPWRFGASFTDAWLKDREAEGLEVISEVEYQSAAAARFAINVSCGEWLAACDTQVLVSGEYVSQGGIVIPVSGLIDFVPRFGTPFEDFLGDLKTCNCAHHAVFNEQAFKLQYHVQAALDLDLYNAATGQDRNTWAFIVQENFEPWEVNRCIYGQEQGMGNPGFLELGREQYTKSLELYAQCLSRGVWPRYNDVDEYELADGGWVILRPRPFQAERAAANDFVLPAELEDETEPESEEALQ